MIDQTQLVHDLITLQNEVELSHDVDPLEYQWFAVRDKSSIIPVGEIMLTYAGCRWHGKYTGD